MSTNASHQPESRPPGGQNTALPGFDYDRPACRAGVIHVGIGAFHRAHQAVFFDRLLHLADTADWGIIGVNLRRQDRAIVDAMTRQDNRYTLKTISPDGELCFREIGAILQTVDAAEDMNTAAALAADPGIAIISTTVTESGYYLLEDGRLDIDNPDVADALADADSSCVYRYLREALNHRRRAEAGPITLVNCDNLRENGHKLRSGLQQFLSAAGDDALLDWIDTQVSFPNGMVDRITPRPEPETAAEIEQRFGHSDDLALAAESFIQWVLEDDFAGRRPALDEVGVTYVDDVSPYEEAKIRILNAGHSVTAYLAALKGYQRFDAAIADPELSDLFECFQSEEAIPALGASPVDLPRYKDVIRERFGNPHISDAVARICIDGVAKITTFVLPTLLGSYQRGHRPVAALQGIAAWYVFMRHVRAGTSSIEYIEPQWDSLQTLLAEGQEQAFVHAAHLWGQLPVDHPDFPSDLLQAIADLQALYPIHGDGERQG